VASPAVTAGASAAPLGARTARPSSAPSLRDMLAPRFYATRNSLRHRGLVRPAVLALLTLAFWGGCFYLFVHVLDYFQTIGDFGPLLTQRLLLLLLSSFFLILLISNTVAGLTTFYLSEEVTLLLAAPIDFRRLHHARFAETLIQSSWMVLLFGLPAFLAYGLVYDAGPLFYAGSVAMMIPFLIIPAAIGIVLVTALVLILPARRVRDAMLVGIGLLVGAAFLAARLLRPEQLAERNGLVGFTAFLVGLDDPSPWLPTTWASKVLVPLLRVEAGEPWFYLAMLYSTAAMLFLVSTALVEKTFVKAWSAAQQGRVHGGEQERPLSRWLRLLARPLPRTPALLFVKDLTIFLRDASQWSQLILLFVLVVIYVYNFSALPISDGTALAIVLRDIAALCNLGLAAFVTTAVAVRFVYPMVSLEGRSWWILKSAPVALERIWWSKFWIGFVPLSFFGLVLVGITNHLLGVDGTLTALFVATLLPMIAAIVAMGLAFGALYPRLDTQNAAHIATGFGAIVYMVSSLGFIAVVVALEAWPVSRLFWRSSAVLPFELRHAVLSGVLLAATIAVLLTTFFGARRIGLRALRTLQV
jgi:ABC-2 type transport system permease protein